LSPGLISPIERAEGVCKDLDAEYDARVTPYSRYAAWIRNRLCLELLVVWRVQRVIGDAHVEPVVCVIVSGGPIWVGDAEYDRASINAIGGRGRLGSIRGTSYWN
jgi:hypothetical protein